jgi:HK97 family phage prohead protease
MRTKRMLFSVVGRSTATADAEILITTPASDRMDDVVLSDGAVVGAYMKNPVVLFAHQMNELPVAITTSLNIDTSGIRAQFKWLQNDPLADRVRNAFDQGALRAASIGFRPLEYERNSQGGYTFTRWELLEFSLVPVPANAEAVRTLKQYGLADDAEPVAVVVDGEPRNTVNITPELLTAAIQQFVAKELAKATGAVVDDVPLLPVIRAAASQMPALQMDEGELKNFVGAIIGEVVRQTLRRAGGAVD